MADEKLRIVIEAISQQAADQIDNASKALVGIAAAAGVAATAYKALKQVMDMGREGAQIAQLESSYAKLENRVELTTDVMAAMRKATNDTVNDQVLMKGALTLTAGASAEYEKALMAALPQIAEMSKAASKLNPLLGSTEYQFDSLTLAAKRQSKQIADNAGINIDMGKAIQEVHPSLQMLANDYNDLTSEQKFLNEMLFQGQTLIEQAGGSIEATTDVFEQLDVATKKYADTVKKELIPAATGLAKYFKAVVEAQTDALDIQQRLKTAQRSGYLEMEDYTKAITQAQYGEQGREQALQTLLVAESRQAAYLEYNKARLEDWRDTVLVAGSAALTASEAQELAGDRIFTYAEKAQFGADMTAYMATQAGEAALANASLALSLKDATEAAAGQAVIGMLNDAYRDGQIEASTYATAITDIGMATGLMDEKSAALAGNLILITDGLVKNQSEAGNMGEAVNLAFQSAQTGVENFGSYLESQLPGLVHASQKASLPHLEKMKEDLDNPRMSAEGIGEALRKIPGTYEATVIIHTIGGVPSLGAGGGGKVDSEEKYGNAAGGSWMIGPSWHNDSFPLGGGRYAQAGEQVDVTPAGQTAAQNAMMSAWMEKLDNTLDSLPRRIAREMLTTVV